MATPALENSNRKIDVGSEKHSVLNIWFSGYTQVRKVALDQADPGPLGWTPVCRWSTLMYICNTYFLIYLIMFIFDQKENSSSAPRLHCDAHQAFANLYQVYQTRGPWASPAQQPWPWVTGPLPGCMRRCCTGAQLGNPLSWFLCFEEKEEGTVASCRRQTLSDAVCGQWGVRRKATELRGRRGFQNHWAIFIPAPWQLKSSLKLLFFMCDRGQVPLLHRTDP